jgi:hypothetical protein
MGGKGTLAVLERLRESREAVMGIQVERSQSVGEFVYMGKIFMDVF